MDRFTETVINEIGNAVPGASVQILDAAGNPAVIYSTRTGTPQANPIKTDALGKFSFCAADGLYTARVSFGGVLKNTFADIRLEDPADGNARYAQADGATLIGTTGGSNVQADLTGLRTEVDAWEPYVLPAATSSILGGVKVGTGINLTGDTISVAPYTLPVATASVLGGVKQGTGVTIDVDGKINATANTYTLPTASASVLGGIKVGEGLAIAGGVLSATGVTSGSVATVNSIAPSAGNVTLVTDDIAEDGAPANRWFTDARAVGAVLTGYVVAAVNAVVAATDTVSAAIGKLQKQVSDNASAKDASGGYAGLTLYAINIKNAAGTITSKIASLATAARTWSFPDKDGTVVLDTSVGEAGLKYFDSGTTNTLDYRNGNVQRWAPASGAKALSITNWPVSGRFGVIQVEGINLAAGAIPTWPSGTVFVKPDDTEVATFAELGIALKTSGTDRVLLWTKNGGTTVYLKVR